MSLCAGRESLFAGDVIGLEVVDFVCCALGEGETEVEARHGNRSADVLAIDGRISDVAATILYVGRHRRSLASNVLHREEEQGRRK